MKRNTIVYFQIISTIIAAMMLFGSTVFALPASADSHIGFEYAVEDGKATITGFSGSGDIAIPSEIEGYPVVRIGVEAFTSNEAITSVEIPDSVTEIGNGAFMSCPELTGVTIGDGTLSIGVKAFMECGKLDSLKIGKHVKSIGTASFAVCSSLVEVDIPESVEVIDSSAFQACASLEKVTGGSGVKSIGTKAFAGCTSLLFAAIGERVTSVGPAAFAYCGKLEEIIIPDGVEKVDDSCFLGCTSLKTVTLNENVIAILRKAFSSCTSLERVENTENVKTIGASAFAYCKSLPEAVLPDGIDVIESGTFAGCTSIKNVVINDKVTAVGAEAFYGCSSLERLEIGKNVSAIGDGAFASCTSLGGITLDSENGSFTVKDGSLYDKEMSTVLCCPAGKTGYTFPDSVTAVASKAFSGCDKLVTVLIPEIVTDIRRIAFYGCSSLSEITLHDGITEIGDATFYGCSSLKKITISDKVNAMGADIFTGCDSLIDIFFEGTRAAWEEISVNARAGELAFVHCSDDPPLEFTDVKSGDYFANAVMWAIINDVTRGTSKTEFSPGAGCTRGQVVTFLWRAAGKPDPVSEANQFSDVKEEDYYYKAVLWAAENDITKGTSDTSFSPSEVCTRGQIVTFLWRTAGMPESTEIENPFEDVKDTDYYYKSVLWAVEKGITKGTDENAFSPSETCTRGQVVTFLFRNKT